MLRVRRLKDKRAKKQSKQYRERLEELVEDHTLQLVMTNERLQNEIAEREVIEAELRSRNDELETFAHTISHDLRSSVAVIKGYAQVALEGNQELLQECLEKIVYLSQRMDSFIASLLAYSEAGRPEGKPESLRPYEVLEEIVAEREVEIAARNIEVEIKEELPGICVDPVRLQQVFINLLDNAFKYTGDKTKNNVAIFYVSDNGVGIERDEYMKIFEPFERLGNENHYGLGIGLSTVKRAVEGWGGRVWVKSIPGKGSTFYFTVPANSVDPA
jgi:signal transduction histidine kinase